jgi:GT2 family glycosyltransferase
VTIEGSVQAAADAAIGAVVVSYQSADDLAACLEALLAADGVVSVVVVDNASTDGSVEVAHSFGDPRLRSIPLDHNTGFAGGCNRGFAALTDDVAWVAFVNPDVRVAPDCLARAATAAGGDASVVGVAPLLMRPDGDTVDSFGQVLSPTFLEVRDRGYGRAPNEVSLVRRDVLAPCGALALYRREALREVADHDGPWAEHFFCFWEDLELGWRLTNRGGRIVTAPDAVAVHGRGAGADSGRGPLRWRRPPELEACVLSNRWMTLARHLHIRDLVARLPVLLVYDLAMTGLSVARRPRLAGHLGRRLELVYREWGRREQFPRKRLVELPW